MSGQFVRFLPPLARKLPWNPLTSIHAWEKACGSAAIKRGELLISRRRDRLPVGGRLPYLSAELPIAL